MGAPHTTQTDDSNGHVGHVGHVGHFVALPNTGEIKYSDIEKNRAHKKDVRTDVREKVPNVPNVPNRMLITYPTDLPAFTATIRACASVARALETHGPRKGGGLAWVSDWLAPP